MWQGTVRKAGVWVGGGSFLLHVHGLSSSRFRFVDPFTAQKPTMAPSCSVCFLFPFFPKPGNATLLRGTHSLYQARPCLQSCWRPHPPLSMDIFPSPQPTGKSLSKSLVLSARHSFYEPLLYCTWTSPHRVGWYPAGIVSHPAVTFA